MRLFIAVNFNNDTRSRLTGLCEELRGKSERGNFSLPENLHLTLAFLGECGDKQSAAAKSVLGAVIFKPFDMTFDRIGRFKRNGGDIWWAGLRESKPLSALQRDLTNRLTAVGFALENRKFTAHITLGREVVTDFKPRAIEPFGETAAGLDLMKSERIGGKLTYTAIASKGAAPNEKIDQKTAVAE
ncbi:MAG: RNA 2',3'-cyclic phosphodiesterase [Oscillospiraceae bacterium]|nr:RNA 2',3'-cyclic phosphodiesterase [Oscillospiraceae bacterium]